MLTQDPPVAADAEIDPRPPLGGAGSMPERALGTVRRLRTRLHRSAVARRAPMVKAHRWVSFLVLGWVVLESVTGVALVFRDEIDHAWNTDTFTSTPGDVGPAAAMAAAREARPDDVVRSVEMPTSHHSGGMYLVFTTGVSDGLAFNTVVVDPGSGEVTNSDHHPPALIGLAERLHFNLNSTSLFGFEPLSVLGAMSILWLLVIVTGAYLWYWPGVKRWARAVRVRRSRGRFTFHLDLHKALGLVSLVPLTLVVLTGINFAFPREVARAWETVTLGAYDADHTHPLETSTPLGDSTPIDADRAREIVAELDPNLRIENVTTPGGSPVGVWEVHAEADAAIFGQLGGARAVEFVVDQHSGAVVAIEDPRDQGAATEAYESWTYPVHTGTFGGVATRVLWVGVGLAPVALGVTGTVMWFARRNKRHRRQAPETRPAADASTEQEDE